MSFDTNQPSQMQGLLGYTVDPLFTVGETINGYVPPGILDGTGAYELNGTTVRVLVNHELANNVGYKYTLENGTQLPGARISYFDIDKRTLTIKDSGLAFDKIYNRAGQVVDAASDLEFAGINRFCAANLFEAYQFGSNNGFADRIYMAGEETDGGTQFALDTATGDLWALPWLGRAAWESTTELNTGTTNKVALLIGDDRDPAPLLLYVGQKNAKGDGSFLDRNGLAQGELFVWVADDPNNATDPIEADPRNFAGSGNSANGRFVEIDYYRPDLAGTAVDGPDSGTSIQDELGYDAQGFATQAQQDKLAADVQAFLFSRPEDVATNPFDGTQAVLASTGRESIFGGADTWGTTYKIDVDFGANATTINAVATILYDGNEADKRDFGLRSPDNLDWADDGKIYIQEDRAISSSLFGATSKQEASIWVLDPSAANPAATAQRVAQIDRSAVPSGQGDVSPTDLGNWESSGVLDISDLLGNKPGTVLLFDVEAHSVRTGTIVTVPGVDTDGDGTLERTDNLVEGGQLSLLIAPGANLVQDSTLVVGSPNADIKSGGIDFDGVNDLVFTGAGNDEVDVPLAGALSGFNRISVGSGKDTVFAADGDRVFGDAGDDLLDATDASGARLSGGAGNDDFFLGTNGRALGGEGNDRFFVQSGGGNILSGGAGSDQFWMLTDSLPSSPNTIADFAAGTDVIGIANQGAGVDFADLSFSGNNIALNGSTIAILTGIQTNTLTAANFVFASL